LNDEEIDKKLKRKKKRLREKQGANPPTDTNVNEDDFLKNISNRFSHISTLTLSKPAHSFSFLPTTKNSYNSIVFCFNNNNLGFYQIIDDPDLKGKITMKEILAYDRLGHRSAIRTIALSTDDNMILSGSGENIKIWSLEGNYQCMKTFKSGFCTCSLFLPKSRFFVVGEKEGVLRLFDLNKAEQIQELQAHEASIWSVTFHEKPAGWDNIVIVTGSADKKLKFWELVLNKINKDELMLTGF
jgi:U3 small nucleolar RNA-associated protein 12